MANIQDQITQARAAGYSDDDIAAHLSKTPDYGSKMQTALSAGYKPTEILAHLVPEQPAAPKRSAWDKASAGDVVAGLPATRMIAGIAAPVVGALQLGADAGDWIAKKLGTEPILGKFLAEKIGEFEASQKRGMAALDPTPEWARGSQADMMGTAGSVVSGGLALKNMTPATTYLGGVVQGGAVGAGLGATTPTGTSGLVERGKNAMVGGATGGAVSAVVPAAVAGYTRLVKPLVDAQGTKNSAILKAAEGKANELRRMSNAAEANTPGAVVAGAEATAPAQIPSWASLAEGVKRTKSQAYFAQDEGNNAARVAHAARVDANLSRAEASLVNSLSNKSQLETGQSLTESAANTLKRVQASEVTPAYNAAFALAPNATIDLTPALATAKSIRNGTLETLKPELAPETSKILSIFGPKTPETVPLGAGKVSSKLTVTPKVTEAPKLTLREADSVLKAINIDSAALKNSTDTAANVTRANLAQLRTSVSSAIEAGISPEAKAAHDAARALFKEKVADVFYTGAPANLRRQSSVNEAMLKPEDIIPKVLSSEGNATQFLKTVQTPAAKQELSTGVESAYRDAVVKNGIVDPKAHAKFMTDNAPALRAIDAAGIPVTPRLQSIGTQAETQFATRAGSENTLRPVAPGTQPASTPAGFTPLRLVDPTAIGKDLEREALQLRLAAKVRPNNAMRIASSENDMIGVHWFNQIATLSKSIMTKLQGKLDQKLAEQVATDMLTTKGTSAMLRKAIIAGRRSDNFNKAFAEAYGVRQAAINQLAPTNLNALAPSETRIELNNMASNRK